MMDLEYLSLKFFLKTFRITHVTNWKDSNQKSSLKRTITSDMRVRFKNLVGKPITQGL